MQPSSTRLALLGVAANLGLCLALGVTLLTATGGSDPAPLPAAATDVVTEAPEPSSTTTTSVTRRPSTTSTTTTETSRVPVGYERVTGPGGMTTVVPEGWPTEVSTGPGNMQATDPADANRLLKYGGAPAPAEDIHSSHVAYEAQIAKRPAYRLIRLDQLTFHGTDAVDWEFEWTPPEGRRHVRSLYWRSGGYEFFVYAAAPVDKWPETQNMLDVMIDNATP